MTPVKTLSYGRHPDQHIRIASPEGQGYGTVYLIHGGYWRQQFTLELMRPVMGRMVGRGWHVVNVEYRRGSEHGWPIPLQDVEAALSKAVDEFGPEANAVKISIGHSVGGQLALLSARHVSGVVALAPVTDVRRTGTEALGERAVEEYFGKQWLSSCPKLMKQASPLFGLPVAAPTLLIHGAKDTRVPLSHSVAFFGEALRYENPMESYFPQDQDHFTVVAPGGAHWACVDRWMNRLIA